MNAKGESNKRQTLAMIGVSGLVALAFYVGDARAQTTNSRSHSNSSSSSASLSNSRANSNQSQSASNALSINTSTPANQTIKNVPNVYAPGLAAAGTEVCLGSMSAGGAAAGFGLTVGGTTVDKECQLRLNARTLATLGYTAAAREEMCLDPQVRQAMASAGTPCAADARANILSARAEYEGPLPQTPASPPEEAAVQTVSAAGCRREYQLIGGWYERCGPNDRR